MKKIIVILGVVIAVAVVVFFLLNDSGDLSTQVVKDEVQKSSPKKETSKFSKTPQEQADNAIEAVVKSVQEKKEVTGIATSIAKPNNQDVIYLEIRADVVDVEGIKDVDFTKKSANLPMVRKKYRVAVDNLTKLVKLNDKNDLESGSMVRVVSAVNVYDAEEFTAVELELITKR